MLTLRSQQDDKQPFKLLKFSISQKSHSKMEKCIEQNFKKILYQVTRTRLFKPAEST